MNSSNYSEEIKRNAAKRVSALTFNVVSFVLFPYLIMCAWITRIVLYLCLPCLESQSEKDYAKSKYYTRIRNSKNATNRKHKALHVYAKNSSSKKKSVRNNGKTLDSQSSVLFADLGENVFANTIQETCKEYFKSFTSGNFEFPTVEICKEYFNSIKLGDFSLPFITGEQFNLLWEKFKEFFYGIPLLSILYEDLPLILRCDIAKTLCTLLSMIVTLGWLPKIDYKIRGVSIFESEAMRQSVSITAIYDVLTKLVSLLKEALMKFPEHGVKAFYLDEHKLKYELEIATLRAQKVLIDVGRDTTMDALEFDRRIEEAIQETLKQMAVAQGHEKSVLNNTLKEFKAIQASRTLAKRDYIREKPYGILLYGGSSVGKSAMSNALIRYVLEVNGLDSSPRSVIVLNEFDKFQSEYRTYHSGVIFDDLCNGTPDKQEGNPLMKIIQFINNSPQAALNPNVEMKGNVMVEPRVCLATTNVKGLNAAVYSEEPISVSRRFDLIITQKVRPEFCKRGTEMLDSSKVYAKFGDELFPDFATFDIEYATTVPNQADRKKISYQFHQFEGRTMEGVDIRTMLRFLKSDSAKHFLEQRRFVRSQKANEIITLCSCGSPASLCKDCVLESQFCQFPDLLKPLLECEEFIYSLITKGLLCLLDTTAGQGLLIYHVRKTLLSYYRNMFEMYCIKLNIALAVILQLLFFGVLGARFILVCLCIFVLITYIIYMCIKNQIKRKIKNLPRVSTWIRNLDFRTKVKILSFIGGVSTLTAIIKFVRYMKTLPVAQAAAPIRIFPKEGASIEEDHPKWGVSGMKEREKAFKIDPDLPHDTMCMTADQMFNSLKRRQMNLRIDLGDSFTFCNTVPLISNVLVIPNHIIPTKACKACISKPGAPYKNVYIQPESTYNIPKTDFALWYLPELGDQKDITAYLPNNIPHGKTFEAFLMYNNNGTIERYDKMLVNRSTSRSDMGGSFESITYEFPGQTFNGLCGATVVAKDLKQNPFIGGFHLAGKGSSGAAGFLTRTQVLDAIKQLNKRPGIMVSHSAQAFKTTIMGINVGPLVEPHEKSVVHQLKPEAKCVVFGQHNQPRSTPSSKVVTSMISESVVKNLGLPKIHGPPCEMRDDRHKLVDVEGKSDTAYAFQLDSFNKAYEDFEKQILDGLTKEDYAQIGKMSIDAVLAGYDGVNGINSMEFGTAAGFPLKGTKRQFVCESQRFVEGISCPRDVDEEILEEVRRIEEELKNGNRINTVFKASLKDEPVKIGKTKVRVFAGSNMPFTMTERKYFLSLSALMQKKKELFECACGVNVYSPEWDELMKGVFRHGKDRIVAGDYKAFDTRMSPRFMLAAFKILIRIAEESENFDEEDLTIMRGIAAEVCNPTYDHFGVLIQFLGSNPSGHPLTVVINSLVNSLYMRYCYYEIAKQDKWWKVPSFNKVVALMTYGDDNIMSVAKKYDAFNHTRVSSILAEAGLTYTMADKEAESVPFITADEAGFLKHNAVYDHEMGLYRAVIEENSIQKTLHTHIKSDVLTEEMHSASAITDVLDKYFHFGEEFYNKRKCQLEEVARECGLIGYIGELKTYEEQMIRFCDKYSWPLPSKYQP